MFWLACPHCYAFEPFLRAWLKSKPGYVEFVRVPVMWQPVHKSHAHLYYTLEALGREDLVAKAFETMASRHELHVQRQRRGGLQAAAGVCDQQRRQRR